MSRILMFFFSCLFIATLSAQHTVSKDVQVAVKSSKRDQETSLVYSATNNTVGRQTIVLNVEGRSFERADGSIPVVRELLPGSNRLLQLTNISAYPRYGYLWVAGCVDTKPRDIVYLPPVRAGKTTQLFPLQDIGNWLKEQSGEEAEKPSAYISYAFALEPGDQVFAARRGTVIEIVENRDEPTGENLSYFERYNYVVLEHEDCTRGKYAYFAKDGIDVGLGQLIEAGAPLGRVMDGSALANGTQLRFAVYFTDVSRRALIEKYEDRAKTYRRKYVTTTFHGIPPGTDNKKIKVEHPEKVIVQEMRKRDIKKWRKQSGGKR